MEKCFLPLKAERKLTSLFRQSSLLRQAIELQNKIIAWAKNMLEEAREEWDSIRADTITSIIKSHNKTKAIKGAKNRDKKYATFRKEFALLQKEHYQKAIQNGYQLTANRFVTWFLINKALELEVPYTKQNQKNKLIQLAQANNREFKKLFI